MNHTDHRSSAVTGSPSVVIIGKGVHPPWNEGVRVIARNIGRALQSAGHQTRTISLSDAAYSRYFDDSPYVNHVPTKSAAGVRGDYMSLMSGAQAANKAAGNRGPAAFHLVGAPLALSPFIQARDRRVIAHIPLAKHTYLSRADRLRAMLGWRAFDRWIDVYACTSRAICADLAKQGYPARKLQVVPPPIDVQQFSHVDRQAARRALGLDPNAFLVVYVGTVSPLRFPASEVLGALEAAGKDVPNLALEVFAPVATHDYNIGWVRDNVSRAAEGAGVKVNTHLRDLSEDEKVAAYSAADLVLLPFAAPVAVEPPLTLLEAMSCEATVLVSPHANYSQVVEDGSTGATYSSPPQLANRVRELYRAGAESRSALGARARDAILQDYAFQPVARALENLWGRAGMEWADFSLEINQGTIGTNTLS